MPIYRFEKYLLCRAFSEVYRSIGNGFSKPVYLEALAAELELHNIPFVCNPELILSYKSVQLKESFVPDFLCFDKILVIVKASRLLSSELIQQFSNSINMTSQAAGYLINFGAFPHLQCFFVLALPHVPPVISEPPSIDKSLATATLSSVKSPSCKCASLISKQSANLTEKTTPSPHPLPRIVTKHNASSAKIKST